MKKYYVYRFLNSDGIVIYVGRTKDLYRRFSSHEHITEKVAKIEYIECDSEAEMAWKEVYYINLFYNELSENSTDVYRCGVMTDIGLTDKWKTYNKISNIHYIKSKVNKFEYYRFMNNIPKLDYKSLIRVVNHNKLNYCFDNRSNKSNYYVSKEWLSHPDNANTLKKHTINFFKNLCVNKSELNMWTTYPEFKNALENKGYIKGYTNPYYDDTDGKFNNKIYLAFLMNSFDKVRKEYSDISDDQRALYELLFFIFKSAIRDGKEIYVYIPSIRMRKLLEQWIEENSIHENSTEQMENM